ncbi:Alpha/Beta hydrolase protein [Rhodotorula diobovata]|uniref:Alpha/Beta hydrolase protein n=1 Tax=Rhodotorula diobovata TaxID=5288 RepID=A0A5C5FVZ2_9BASI|nr:Alpha/Beta hydrolase protein [Rhodotorula diobovata]
MLRGGQAAAAARSAASSARRSYATAPVPVELSFEKQAPAAGLGSSQAPLVVLHGLYGSKQNWRSLAKGMASKLGRDLYTLDLRNHGASPHKRECSYEDLAADVKAFIEERERLSDCIVVGHSMGGKVAMALALGGCDPLSKLVVVDIAPGVGKVSPEFQAYLDAMKAIDDAKVMSRKEADAILQKTEPDLGIRQFLLTNMDRADPSSPYRFRLPLHFLRNAIDEIGHFPYAPGEKVFEKPSLFLKGASPLLVAVRRGVSRGLADSRTRSNFAGAKSKYINSRNIPIIKQFFPNSQLETLDAGHWVHAERPKEFVELLHTFCNKD